jgi:hypothetical protein
MTRKSVQWSVRTSVLLAGFLIAGCEPVSPIYQDSHGQQGPASITPKSAWRAAGDLANPAKAVDGDLQTVATVMPDFTGRALTIDLSKPCLFQMVIIEHGSEEVNYAPSVEVAVSMDGRTFQPVFVGVGTRRVTTLLLPSPTLGRYLRIKAVKSSDRPWSVAEVYLQ